MNGKTFAAIRNRLGLTQEELAEDIGVHRVSIANWETGHKHISVTIARLMTCLDRERRMTKKARRK